MSNDFLNEMERKFVSCVSEALDAVRMTKDPEELNKYRRLFKKNVPFTMRSYVAAYLAKETVLGNVGCGKNANASKEGRGSHTGKPKIVLDEKDAKVLFFSVGRRRGINPRDIITLIMQNVDIPREHIGEIRILENYCFVQIMTGSDGMVVSGLNNFRYRGRPLSVSYATKTDKDIDLLLSDKEVLENKEDEVSCDDVEKL